MEVFVCGQNSFNQLSLDIKRFTEENHAISSKNSSSDGTSIKMFIASPRQLLLLDNVEAEINIHFTWSRCITSIKTSEKGKSTSYVSDSDSEKKTQGLCFENMTCASVVGGSGAIVLQDTMDPSKFSVLHQGQSQPLPLTVGSNGKEMSSLSLQKLSGGHTDIYAVYDGVSFGKFQVTKPLDAARFSIAEGQSDVLKSDATFTIEHIDFVTPIKEVSCGKEHVLLLSMGGGVYSYGLSSRGQLGHGEIEKESCPRLVDALDGLPMRSVVAGGWHSVAVSEIGDLYVWGWNESGQLGLKSIKPGENVASTGCDDSSNVGIVATPVCVETPNGENVKDTACGSRHTVVLTDSGQIFTCGWNAYGQLGLGDTINRDVLTKVGGLTGHRVFAGHWNTVFLCKHGRAVD